jgi:uncharacterized membrane protein
VNLPAQLIPLDWLWLANLVFGFFLLHAIRRAPWKKLLNNPVMVNALVGLMFGIFLLWQLNAGIRPGFNFHILGATLFVLMFGWQIATTMLTLVMCATWLRMDIGLVTLGINGLLMIVVPVLFTEWLLRFSKRRLPMNLFVFVLLNGFVCAAIGITLMVLATSIVLAALSPYTWADIQYHYWIPAIILIFTESFATGMVTTGFTVSQPTAMMNFSDEEYINGK